MVDIRKIVTTSYISFRDSEEVKSYVDVLSINEVKKVVGVTVNAMTKILYYYSPYVDFVTHRMQLTAIDKVLEGIPETLVKRPTMVEMGSNKIFAFARQDENEVAEITDWEKPISAEKLEVAARLSQRTKEYFFERVREDFDKYQQKMLEGSLTDRHKKHAKEYKSRSHSSQSFVMQVIEEGENEARNEGADQWQQNVTTESDEGISK